MTAVSGLCRWRRLESALVVIGVVVHALLGRAGFLGGKNALSVEEDGAALLRGHVNELVVFSLDTLVIGDDAHLFGVLLHFVDSLHHAEQLLFSVGRRRGSDLLGGFLDFGFHDGFFGCHVHNKIRKETHPSLVGERNCASYDVVVVVDSVQLPVTDRVG